MSVESHLKTYLGNPAYFFLENTRQASKLQKSLERAEKLFGLNRNELIEFIIAAARLRVRYAQKTIYIQNIGSSGSHWLKTILGESFNLLAGGEIYIANKFYEEVLPDLPNDEAMLCMQAIMLAHVIIDNKQIVSSPITNTAHVPNINKYTKYDIHASKILLARDPVDIVLSRTFRKDEFRQYAGYANISDNEYVQVNIKRVNNFFTSALSGENYYICKYEDLVKDTFNEINNLAKFLDLSCSAEKLNDVIDRSRPERQKEGAGIKTNLYQGASVEIDTGLVSSISDQLKTIREKLGYI